MPLTYLDKNALSNLWRCPNLPEQQLVRARRRLTSPLFNGPTIVVEAALLKELANAPVERKRQELEFLASLPRCRVLKDFPQRLRAEVRAHADRRGAAVDLRANPADVYFDDHEVSLLFAYLRDRQPGWTELLDSLIEFKEMSIAADEAVRLGMLAEFGNQKAVGRHAAQWLAGVEGSTAHWALWYLEQRASQLGLPAEKREWPRPQELPTLWAHFAYSVTRLFLVLRDGRAIDPNDVADKGHYAAAAYCDSLVVDDRKFRGIISQCPGPKPRVLTFVEWLQAINGPASG